MDFLETGLGSAARKQQQQKSMKKILPLTRTAAVLEKDNSLGSLQHHSHCIAKVHRSGIPGCPAPKDTLVTSSTLCCPAPAAARPLTERHDAGVAQLLQVEALANEQLLHSSGSKRKCSPVSSACHSCRSAPILLHNLQCTTSALAALRHVACSNQPQPLSRAALACIDWDTPMSTSCAADGAGTHVNQPTPPSSCAGAEPFSCVYATGGWAAHTFAATVSPRNVAR